VKQLVVENLQTTLKDGKIFVLGIGSVELDTPMPIAEFQKYVTELGTTVKDYFDAVAKLNAELKEQLNSLGIPELANALRDELITLYQKETGVTIHAIVPNDTETKKTKKQSKKAEPESTNSGDSKFMTAMDWHLKYRDTEDKMDVADLRRTQMVLLCEEYLYMNHHCNGQAGNGKNRHTIRVTTKQLWDHIQHKLDKPEGVLDPRLEENLLGVLIAEGWRVIGRCAVTVHGRYVQRQSRIQVLPYGRGVPGCHLAKRQEDDHPFWGRTDAPIVPGL